MARSFRSSFTQDPKPLGSSGKFLDSTNNTSIGAIRSIRVNSNGTRLSILSDKVHGALKIREPDSRLHVYDSDRDIVDHYDFKNQKRIPVSHFWDPSEPKLLSCETRLASVSDSTNSISSSPTDEPSEQPEEKTEVSERSERVQQVYRREYEPLLTSSHLLLSAQQNSVSRVPTSSLTTSSKPEITTMFVTADFGIKMQDVFALEKPLETLLGLDVPRLYFVSTSPSDGIDSNSESKDDDSSSPSKLMSKVMRDFVGLEDVDNITKAALLDFSYFLTIGNMDEAYRAVKLIKNPSVWENMAHMCVKTKRLDVAEVCLGNMGHARGAAAVRLAKNEPELEAAVGAVAVQLGLLEDAERLFKECGRYDLLNNLYQGQGKWEEGEREKRASLDEDENTSQRAK